MSRIATAVAWSVIAAGSLNAAESFTELRLGLGFVPGIKAAEVTGPAAVGGDYTVDLDKSAGGNLDAGIAFGRIGEGNAGIGGYLGLFMRTHNGKDDADVDTKVGAFGINLGVDLLLASSRRFMLSIGPRVALGAASQSIDMVEYKDGTGSYASLALQIGGYAAINSRIRVGLELGAMSWASSATQTYDDGVDRADLDITMHGSGVYGSVVLGITL